MGRELGHVEEEVVPRAMGEAGRALDLEARHAGAEGMARDDLRGARLPDRANEPVDEVSQGGTPAQIQNTGPCRSASGNQI